ncbi:hypothetical protein EZS27_015058 [termite gut metagenome]|uniref:Phosphatidic acid phosphatase type 2/haloperoxidase domain-containing protein n=1 Tax=termite gut metagenome TaxID=433724 RepID=A0A5J4RSU8_9ZZZZ
MRNNLLIKTGEFILLIFTPYVIPFGTFLVLFLFSYLRIMPWQYKSIVLGIIFCFTILLPLLFVFLSRLIRGSAWKEPDKQKNHYLSYFPIIISYIFCSCMMLRMSIPRYMTAIIVASLFIMIAVFCFNLKWRLSGRMAGVGGIIGALVSFSALFGHNPIGWLCICILISGVLGTYGIILRRHSFGEVLVGFAIGLAFSLMVLYPNPLSNMLFEAIS